MARKLTIRQRKIAYWPINCIDDAISLLQYVIKSWKSLKNNDYTGISLKIDNIYVDGKNTDIKYMCLSLYTFKIKANEYTIEALEMNKKFWNLYWSNSARGGYYQFTLERITDDHIDRIKQYLQDKIY